jgi:hypothetical protein
MQNLDFESIFDANHEYMIDREDIRLPVGCDQVAMSDPVEKLS